MAEKKEELTFEGALARVEELAARMDDGKAPLEELLTNYEEGLRLLKFCEERLDAAEKRLEKVTRDAAGKAAGIGPAE